MIDNGIIELFFARSEQAISELQKKYGALCRRVAYNILSNHEEADETVNMAFFSVWNAIPPARPSSLCGYVCAAVRNTALNSYAREKRRSADALYDELAEIIPDSRTVESTYDARAIGEYINSFLNNQSRKNADIFVARYYYNTPLAEIGACVGLSEASVKMRLLRMRNALRKYLEERGVDV